MPFTAACPNCRTARFRVPWKRRDETMACPKCEREFTLIPEDEPPLPSVQPSRFVETASLSVSETKPVLPVEQNEEPKPFVDPAYVVALIALVLTGAAVVSGYVPYGRFVGIALAPIGVLLALVSLVSLDRRRWLGWSGVASNLFAFFLLVVIPGWVGMGTWLPPADPNEGIDLVYSVSKNGQTRIPATTVDALSAAWQQNDVRIDLMSARITPLDPAAKTPEQRKAKALRLTMQITNVGVARGIEFKTPDDPNQDIQLTVGTGAPVRKKKIEQASSGPLFPGKTADVILVFDPPGDANASLKLEIPAGWFGQKDPATMTISAAMIAKR